MNFSVSYKHEISWTKIWCFQLRKREFLNQIRSWIFKWTLNICDFHGGIYSTCGVLGCDTVQTFMLMPKFRRKMHHDLCQQIWHISTNSQIRSQKTAIWILMDIPKNYNSFISLLFFSRRKSLGQPSRILVFVSL